MKREITPLSVWAEYEKAQRFKETIGLFETVEKNEDFYIGNQWRGVNAPNLDHPVINILSRVVKFFISSIVSDDIGVKLTRFDDSDEDKPVMDMIGMEIDRIIEQSEFRKKSREAIRNAAVDGDGCMHYFFDPDIDMEGSVPEMDHIKMTPGSIQAEIIENTNIHFGNPQCAEIKKQPYILIDYRRLLEEVKETAQENKQDPEEIKTDEEAHQHRDAADAGKVTVIRRYWLEKNQEGIKTVHFCEMTKNAVVRPDTDTGCRRYPIAFLAWEKVKNQYHGQAAVTGMIPNQIFVNKLFAMAMEHTKKMAFPKIIYNETMLAGKPWDNRVGAAIGVRGDPNAAVASGFRAPDMSNQVLIMIDKIIEYTRDTMGASDASLGNVRPDNTSAIVAVQKATSMPLELQRQDFYCFVEDSVRIWIDIMARNYGVRAVKIMQPDEETGEDRAVLIPFDFAQLAAANFSLEVDIGAATYWSELMQVQTLDNLFSRGVLDDAETYIENMPRGYIPGRKDILDAIRTKREREEALAAQMELTGGIQE